jgi:hypothetical protein
LSRRGAVGDPARLLASGHALRYLTAYPLASGKARRSMKLYNDKAAPNPRRVRIFLA